VTEFAEELSSVSGVCRGRFLKAGLASLGRVSRAVSLSLDRGSAM